VAAPAFSSSLYPSLDDYMGMAVSENAVRQHVPGYVSVIVICCDSAVFK